LLSTLLAEVPEARVIAAQGLETEADIDLAWLDQLLRAAGIQPDVLVSGMNQVDAGLRLLEGLSGLQATRPVVIAVHAVQWSEAASLRAVLFAFRRLTTDRVLALFAVRTDDVWPIPDAVRKLAAARGPTLRLRPLAEADLAELAQGYALDLPARG